jgi:O-antigen ligase
LIDAAIRAQPSPRLDFTSLDSLVVLFVVSALPSLFVTADVGSSLTPIAKDVLMALLYGATTIVSMRWAVVERGARWIAGVAVAISVICVLSLILYWIAGIQVPYLGRVGPVPYFGDIYRLYGGFPSAEYLVIVLGFAAPFVLTQLWTAHGRTRTAWQIGMAALIVAALGTEGHGVVGLVAAATVSIGITGRYRHTVVVAMVTATVLLVVLVNLTLAIAVREAHIVQSRAPVPVATRAYSHAENSPDGASRISLDVTYDVMAYWRLKRLAWEAFRREPVTGIGPGALHADVAHAAATGALPSGHGTDDPHSTWFGRLAETGLLGTASLAALWAAVLVRCRRALGAVDQRAALVAPFLAGAAGVLVTSPNVDVMHFPIVWIAFGVIRSLSVGA